VDGIEEDGIEEDGYEPCQGWGDEECSEGA